VTAPSSPPCDTGRFIARLGGDAELARQMARAFLGQIDRLLAAVRAAVDSGDAEALRRAAHAVKGSAANFDAAPTVAAAAELEQIGRSGDPSTAGAVLARLEAETARLVSALREFGGLPTCAS
jgi:HPt (histidine-containing phosphotransfer) domain-containing protein